MTRLFLLALFVFLTACEDRKSPEENSETDLTETVDNTAASEEKDDLTEEEEKILERPEGPLITQKEFIPFMTEYGKKNPEDKIRIKTRFGDIDVELFHDTPLHRANFIFLVKNDYFDDTFFHRVSEGFVVQGGNSDNPDTNKKRHYIGDYLIPNEFEAGHRHQRGAFAAAKYSEQNVSKASSPYEFYVVQSPTGAPHLNNEHTVFGRVTDGMDVVDEISKVKTDGTDWPLQNIYLDVEIIE